MGANPPHFKKRPTWAIEMDETTPRLMASFRTSLGVQWLMGQSQAEGSSQAMATICNTCCSENFGGVPGRGRSLKSSTMASSSSAGCSCSTKQSFEKASIQRPRQSTTCGRSSGSLRLISVLLTPSTAASTHFARLARDCEVLRRRTPYELV